MKLLYYRKILLSSFHLNGHTMGLDIPGNIRFNHFNLSKNIRFDSTRMESPEIQLTVVKSLLIIYTCKVCNLQPTLPQELITFSVWSLQDLVLERANTCKPDHLVSYQLVTNEFVCMLLSLLDTFQKTLRAVIAVGGRPRFPKEVSFKNG